MHGKQAPLGAAENPAEHRIQMLDEVLEHTIQLYGHPLTQT